MSFQEVNNPDIPYVGEVEGGVFPGKMVKVQGKTSSDAVRFAINYQLGPNLNPRDDIAIHVSPRFNDGIMTRNHIQLMNWGEEENFGPLLIQPGQDFEIIILCKYDCFKIAVNGRHFADFIHRLPFHKISHLTIDGDVEISSIFYESIPDPQRSQHSSAPPPIPHDLPPADFGPPKPGSLYPSLDPQAPNGAPRGFPSGGYDQPSNYGPGANNSGGYNYQPGYQKQEQEEDSGLDKMGLALGGLVAAGGAAAAIYAYNKKKQREREEGDGDHEKEDASKSQTEGGLNLGSLGAALASSLAANALQGGGGTRPQSAGYPSQESGGFLDSILGSLGGGGGGGHQQPSSDPLGGLGALLGGGGHQQPSSDPLGGLGALLGGGGNRQPSSDPLGGLGSLLGGNQSGGHSGSDSLGGLGSLLGNFMGGGHQQQPAYQPSGGYGNNPQPQGSQGSDLLSNLGSSLLSSAFDGLSKRKDNPPTPHHEDRPSYAPPQNPGRQHDSGPPQSSPRSPSPPAPGGGKLSAAEISRGLGLGDDED
ncbi:translation initiation factor IF-2-like isoform X2 [Leptopilina heterotoma]|uniref:translation initiation factor IF-2-like isoform X2 n=1 Tax=Leptopilina heterotoma TaxID=63436 RepID=UPI001CAA4101|nr:translation initiation factor IF-2-like isoform X2 [Leptopilina heterotoma]